MKIGELLEMTQNERLATIAKDHLEVGEKKVNSALKKAGCYPISGKRGWYYDGDPAVLEQSIYDYVDKRFNTRPKANANVFDKKNEVRKIHKPKNRTNSTKRTKVVKEDIPQVEELNDLFFELVGEEKPVIQPKNSASIQRKRMSFDLDTELIKMLKIKAILEEKPLYEVVEESVRQYLSKK